MSFIITFVILFCFWVLLSGHLDFFHILTGVLCSLFVAYVSHDLLIGKDANARRGFGRSLRFLSYLPWLFLQIFKSSLDVAYRTLHPKAPIEPDIIKVKSGLKTELGIVIFANSITLTPGTVSIAAESDGEVVVHAIAKGVAESLQDGTMAERVRKIEGDDV
jgi:multicomponent Na+:H+ antiporter subunit E